MYALKDTLPVTNICHEVILRSREVTDCTEHALVTNIFVANIRRLLNLVSAPVLKLAAILQQFNDGSNWHVFFLQKGPVRRP